MYCKTNLPFNFLADANDAANAQKQQAEVKTDSSDEEEVIPDHRNKYRLDNIKIDVKGLMKGARHTVKKQPRKQDPSPARSDHTHAKPDEQLLTPVSYLATYLPFLNSSSPP